MSADQAAGTPQLSYGGNPSQLQDDGMRLNLASLETDVKSSSVEDDGWTTSTSKNKQGAHKNQTTNQTSALHTSLLGSADPPRANPRAASNNNGNNMALLNISDSDSDDDGPSSSSSPNPINAKNQKKKKLKRGKPVLPTTSTTATTTTTDPPASLHPLLQTSSSTSLQPSPPQPIPQTQPQTLPTLDCSASGLSLASSGDSVEFRAFSPEVAEGIRRRHNSNRASNPPILSILKGEDINSDVFRNHSNDSSYSSEEKKEKSPRNRTSFKDAARPPLSLVPPNLSNPTPPHSRSTSTSPNNSNQQLHKSPTLSGLTGALTSSSPSLRPTSIYSYVKSSILDTEDFGNTHHHINSLDSNMRNFISVPHRLESLLLFGFLVTVDCFLYILTFLPLKVFLSLTCLTSHSLNKLIPLPSSLHFPFHRRNLYDLLRGLLILTSTYVLYTLHLGILYHWIRGQAMIKLYVLIAITEVFDRLLCSFGQDALDSLYWNSRLRPWSGKLVGAAVIAGVYVVFHSVVLYLHVATLNVAMNSR
ncbi:hypothetical protein TL16_g10410 [Triparma laevis f. inornata]|uniref:Uncharacterized protein n=1 Tax=Triparma laevis f. inornata TaxID=1714386 RepID=A0A9W7BDM2_9STRA|nr:hypothetical protein TL16_g10410 [Triparma laevis f. inornata]